MDDLRNGFDLLFEEHVVPLARRNTGRPVVFTEFGAVDTMEAPFNPADWSMTGQAAVFTDSNGNGLDDGQETQANIYRALFDVIDENVGVVRGVLSWNIGIATIRCGRIPRARRARTTSEASCRKRR